MRLSLVCFFALLYLGLMTGCDATGDVSVDTSPIGVGLSVIGGGIVIAAWIIALVSGGGDDEE